MQKGRSGAPYLVAEPGLPIGPHCTGRFKEKEPRGLRGSRRFVASCNRLGPQKMNPNGSRTITSLTNTSSNTAGANPVGSKPFRMATISACV